MILIPKIPEIPKMDGSQYVLILITIFVFYRSGHCRPMSTPIPVPDLDQEVDVQDGYQFPENNPAVLQVTCPVTPPTRITSCVTTVVTRKKTTVTTRVPHRKVFELLISYHTFLALRCQNHR